MAAPSVRSSSRRSPRAMAAVATARRASTRSGRARAARARLSMQRCRTTVSGNGPAVELRPPERAARRSLHQGLRTGVWAQRLAQRAGDGGRDHVSAGPGVAAHASDLLLAPRHQLLAVRPAAPVLEGEADAVL